MKKIKLKNYKKIKLIKYSLILIILFSLLLLLLNYFNKIAKPILIEYAQDKTEKIMRLILNDSIDLNIDTDNLYTISKNNKNEIVSVDLNPLNVNNYLLDINKKLQQNLKYLEEGKIDKLNIDLLNSNLKNGIICYIPSGIIFNNSFFSNIGPKIPVKLNLIGDISSKIKTNVKNYGINNVLIEVNVLLEINTKIIMPFISNQIIVKSDIPISLKLIQGNIPNYINGFSKITNSTLY